MVESEVLSIFGKSLMANVFPINCPDNLDSVKKDNRSSIAFPFVEVTAKIGTRSFESVLSNSCIDNVMVSSLTLILSNTFLNKLVLNSFCAPKITIGPDT